MDPRRPFRLLTLALLAAAIVVAAASATTGGTGVGSIAEFPLLTQSSQPYGIAAGRDGDLWFTEYGNNSIGRITRAGAITEYRIPSDSSRPFGIAAAANGSLWFTETFAGKIGRIAPTGAIAEFVIPTVISRPFGIVVGPDGNAWFTEYDGNKIGRITPGGAITEFPIPTKESSPAGITAGADGNLWFTELAGNKIGRITPAGAIKEYTVPTAASDPYGIASGRAGDVWFTEAHGNAIGRITSAGVFHEYPLRVAGRGPIRIAVSPQGDIWFTEQFAARLGRLTTAGVLREYPTPTRDSDPLGIAVGPDGNLWFTEGTGNAIGVAVGAPTPSGGAGLYGFACTGCGPLPPRPRLAGCTLTTTATVCATTFQPASPVWRFSNSITETSGGALGLTGSVRGTCSVRASGSGRRTIVLAGAVTNTYRVTQSERCSFGARFADKSAFGGTFSTQTRTTLSAKGGTRDITVVMTIVAGVGRFAGLVGTGSLAHHLALPPNADTSTSGHLPPSPQIWAATLHKGVTGAAVAFPGPTLTATSDIGLLVVTAPGRSCTATAVGGGTTVKLGHATADAFGAARITAKLRPLLHPGTWSITAVCGAATARSSVSVR